MTVLSERYLVSDLIYSDAAVAVHHGYDQMLNRPIMIELLRPDHADPGAATVLREKARRMALAELPFVAALYDQGEEEGRPYLILEELHGTPLAEAAPIPPTMLIHLVTSISTTLEAARDKQTLVPHLDQASIRISPDARIQIVDWGTTPAVQPPANDLAVITPLLTLAATGSDDRTALQGLAQPLKRVIEQALAGGYASGAQLLHDLRQTQQRAEDPTIAVRQAPPTVTIPDAHRLAPSATWRRPWLGLISAIVALAILILVGSFALRRPTGAETPGAQPTSAPSSTIVQEGPATPTAPVGTPYVVATVDGRRLNIRGGPGTTFPVVGALTNGTQVVVVEGPVAANNYRWVRIAGASTSGWCALEALKQR